MPSMKTPYIPPSLKVVSFQTERGFNTSAFERTSSIFLQQSINDEFRAERYNYDDWSSSSPSSDDGKFNYNDWGSL